VVERGTGNCGAESSILQNWWRNIAITLIDPDRAVLNECKRRFTAVTGAAHNSGVAVIGRRDGKRSTRLESRRLFQGASGPSA
jgi:hypothetical protein